MKDLDSKILKLVTEEILSAKLRCFNNIEEYIIQQKNFKDLNVNNKVKKCFIQYYEELKQIKKLYFKKDALNSSMEDFYKQINT